MDPLERLRFTARNYHDATTRTRAERNAAIVAALEYGIYTSVVAAEVGLTPEQVRRIRRDAQMENQQGKDTP